MKDKYLIRSASGAVLNSDTEGLKQYKKLKNSHKEREKEINILRDELNKIKEMLGIE